MPTNLRPKERSCNLEIEKTNKGVFFIMSKTDIKDNIDIEQDKDFIIIKVRKDSPLWVNEKLKPGSDGLQRRTSIVAAIQTNEKKEIIPIWFEDSNDETQGYGLVEFRIVGSKKE